MHRQMQLVCDIFRLVTVIVQKLYQYLPLLNMHEPVSNGKHHCVSFPVVQPK